MLKIAYVAQALLDGSSGVVKKIVAQSRTWQELGHDVHTFLFGREHTRRAAGPTTSLPTAVEFSGHPFLVTRRVARSVIDWTPDLIYLRSGFYWPSIRRLVRAYPTIVEINGNEQLQAQSGLSGLRARLYLHRRDLMMREVVGVVAMTDEHLAKLVVRYPEFARAIPNPLRLSDFPQLAVSGSKHPVLVFLGSPGQPWNGIDKILWLADQCPDWQFEVIGYSAGDLDQPLPLNVRCHGKLNASEYVPILTGCDIALGTMALHRTEHDYASALKTREYIGYGLPVILGYRDPHFTGLESVLELPNTQNNISAALPRVREFVEHWHNRRPQRTAALWQRDASVTERERMTLFEQVHGFGT